MQSFVFNNIQNGNIQRLKKVITVSPAGYKGFYQMGICKFIKENYKLDDFLFSGSSAGSWVSLYLCHKKDFQHFENTILNDSLLNSKTIFELEQNIKENIINNYSSEDFDLEKLFIGTTTVSFKKRVPTFEGTVFCGFETVEDAIDCCIASSHIPFICGKILHYYRNKLVFDGVFGGKKSYLRPDNSKDELHIFPNIFIKKKFGIARVFSFTTLFSRNKFDFKKEIEKGYKDAKENKRFLDDFFG